MQHDEQKIEEIRMRPRKSLTISANMQYISDLKEYAEHIRTQTIEECKACIPQSRTKPQFWFRKEILSALDALK